MLIRIYLVFKDKILTINIWFCSHQHYMNYSRILDYWKCIIRKLKAHRFIVYIYVFVFLVPFLSSYSWLVLIQELKHKKILDWITQIFCLLYVLVSFLVVLEKYLKWVQERGFILQMVHSIVVGLAWSQE